MDLLIAKIKVKELLLLTYDNKSNVKVEASKSLNNFIFDFYLNNPEDKISIQSELKKIEMCIIANVFNFCNNSFIPIITFFPERLQLQLCLTKEDLNHVINAFDSFDREIHFKDVKFPEPKSKKRKIVEIDLKIKIDSFIILVYTKNGKLKGKVKHI